MAATKNKMCKTEHGGQFIISIIIINYSKYNRFLISAVIGSTVDCSSLQYERSK